MMNHFALALLESAKRQGIDERLLCPDRSPSSREPLDGSDLLRILRSLGEAMKDEFCGLASSPCPPGTLSFGIEVMILSDNLGTALDRASRFFAVATTGLQFRLDVQGDTATFEIIAEDPSVDEEHFLIEWHMARWHKLAQWLIGEEIPLSRIEFAHGRQALLSDYIQVYGENCLFHRPTNRLSFASRYLSRDIIRTLADLEVTTSARVGLLAPNGIHQTWRNLLKSVLRARLSRKAAIPTMEELADEFGICSQTLRRRLKAENTSYRKLKAEARQEVVLDSIANDSLTLSQVSLLAGFAETNGLVRAMKTWTGLSPSQYRKATTEITENDIPIEVREFIPEEVLR